MAASWLCVFVWESPCWSGVSALWALCWALNDERRAFYWTAHRKWAAKQPGTLQTFDPHCSKLGSALHSLKQKGWEFGHGAHSKTFSCQACILYFCLEEEAIQCGGKKNKLFGLGNVHMLVIIYYWTANLLLKLVEKRGVHDHPFTSRFSKTNWIIIKWKWLAKHLQLHIRSVKSQIYLQWAQIILWHFHLVRNETNILINVLLIRLVLLNII